MGTAVTTVTATDVDINHVLNYYFLDNPGNPGNAFSMHAHSGQITVAHELDYERQNYYELAVGVSDMSNNSTMQVFVHVDDDNDNSPVFSHSSYQVGTLQLLGTLQLPGWYTPATRLAHLVFGLKHAFSHVVCLSITESQNKVFPGSSKITLCP